MRYNTEIEFLNSLTNAQRIMLIKMIDPLKKETMVESERATHYRNMWQLAQAEIARLQKEISDDGWRRSPGQGMESDRREYHEMGQ